MSDDLFDVMDSLVAPLEGIDADAHLNTDQAFGARDLLGPHGDLDGDGIPNWGDHWFGPGAQSPFGAAGEVLETHSADMSSEDIGDIDDYPFAAGESIDAGDGIVIANDALAGNAGIDLETGAEVFAGSHAPDAEHWHLQEGENSCAVACQRGILESMTGQTFTEAELTSYAEEHGWYDPETGTYPSGVGKLLEANGIPIEQGYDRDLSTLVEALQNDQKIIVGLDANEIWTPLADANGIPLEQPDIGHAVWVTDISITSEGGVEVTVNDTGVPDGAGKTLAAEDFLNAWRDFGCFATITATA